MAPSFPNPPNTMFVKPVEGRQVRDPATRQVVPAEGRTVPRDSYWVRRVIDGDLTAEDGGQNKADAQRVAEQQPINRKKV